MTSRNFLTGGDTIKKDGDTLRGGGTMKRNGNTLKGAGIIRVGGTIREANTLR